MFHSCCISSNNCSPSSLHFIISRSHTHTHTLTHKLHNHTPFTFSTFNPPMHKHTHTCCAPTVAYVSKYLMKVSVQLTVFRRDFARFLLLMGYLCLSREMAAVTATGLWSRLLSSEKNRTTWGMEKSCTVWEREKIDALAVIDGLLLIDCSPLRHLMCCYCSGISGCFPEVIWECRHCWISVSGCCGWVAAAAGGGELHLFVPPASDAELWMFWTWQKPKPVTNDDVS